MDEIFCGLPFLFSLIQHFHTVFAKLIKYGHRINPKKSILRVEYLNFLGHTIDKDNTSQTKENVDYIQNFPLSTSFHELRYSVGILNYYRNHVPHLSQLLTPLITLLKTEQIILFERAKEASLKCTKL